MGDLHLQRSASAFLPYPVKKTLSGLNKAASLTFSRKCVDIWRDLTPFIVFSRLLLHLYKCWFGGIFIGLMDSLSGGLVQLRVGCLYAKAVRLSVTFNNFSSCFCVVFCGFFFSFFFPWFEGCVTAITNQRDIFMRTSFPCSNCLNTATGFYITVKLYLPSKWFTRGTMLFT